ncbi:MAG: histidinol-phosphate transaminase [Candidatus Sumerlaeota bacterium]|nr:histidinol-phosphate transaminase [Candidatus Sumerlaeota bacterium]
MNMNSSTPSNRPPLPREAVRRLTAYTPGEQPSDLNIIKLNTNEFPYPPAPEAVDAVRREAAQTLRRYPNPTCAPLRQALAAEFGVEPARVFVGNGSDEILRLIVQAYAGPGDTLAIADPTYSLYPVLADMFEACVETHATDDEGALPESLFHTRARLILIGNPNPPLGAQYSLAEMERLADLRDSLVLIDEAYAAFAPFDCMELARRRPNVVVARTFSKSHGLAGMRVGYAVGRPEVIEALDKIRDSYNVNRVSQAAALAALRAKDYYSARIREMVRTRERLRAALLGLRCRAPRSAANFLFARCGDGRRLLDALRERRILVRFFDLPGLRDGCRISIGTPEETDALIAALQEILPFPEARP